MPDEEQFIDFDKRDHGLRALAVDTWENFIFVYPSIEPPIGLDEWLGEVRTDLDGGPLKGLIPTARKLQ